MVQLQIFHGTLEAIQAEFNKWASDLVQGAQINALPLIEPSAYQSEWVYMVIVNLPVEMPKKPPLVAAQQMPGRGNEIN